MAVLTSTNTCIEETDYSTYPKEKWCDYDRMAVWIRAIGDLFYRMWDRDYTIPTMKMVRSWNNRLMQCYILKYFFKCNIINLTK